MARIVILGAGVGGMVTANQLRKRLSSEHEVIVVERGEGHDLTSAYPWRLWIGVSDHPSAMVGVSQHREIVTAVEGVAAAQSSPQPRRPTLHRLS